MAHSAKVSGNSFFWTSHVISLFWRAATWIFGFLMTVLLPYDLTLTNDGWHLHYLLASNHIHALDKGKCLFPNRTFCTSNNGLIVIKDLHMHKRFSTTESRPLVNELWAISSGKSPNGAKPDLSWPRKSPNKPSRVERFLGSFNCSSMKNVIDILHNWDTHWLIRCGKPLNKLSEQTPIMQSARHPLLRRKIAVPRLSLLGPPLWMNPNPL